jgi:hypothetical protein
MLKILKPVLVASFVLTVMSAVGVKEARSQSSSSGQGGSSSSQQSGSSSQSNQNAEPKPAGASDQNDPSLVGAQNASLTFRDDRSFLLPSVAYFGQLDSNASNAYNSGNHTFASINSLLGAVELQKTGSGSLLNMNYLVGRSFSNDGGAYNSTTQELGVTGLWLRGRWNGLFTDQLRYSSQAAFFGGLSPFDMAGDPLGAPMLPGVDETPIAFRETFLPGQGVFTVYGPRLGNAAIGEVTNHLTRRTSITFVGNYDILRFFNSSQTNAAQTAGYTLIDSSVAGFQAGLEHKLSRRDTVAVLYRFDDLWFSGFPYTIHDNVAQLAYQRRVGERIIAQISGGPDVIAIQSGNPVSNTDVTWSLDASLAYRLRRYTLGLSFDRFVTGGGGLFLGAISDQVSASASREISRVWTVRAYVNYGRNQNLIPFADVTTVEPVGAAFHSVYGGVQIHRRIGRMSDLFFGYIGRYQTSSAGFCVAGVCGPNLNGQQVDFGFTWRPKLIPIG